MSRWLWILLWLSSVQAAGAVPVFERHPLAQKVGVEISQIFYQVDGLRIEARLFMPTHSARSLPGVVYAHDGVRGLSQDSVARCVELASNGYVVLAPSYRGEDHSQGTVEVAAGEVNDVLAAGKVLQELEGVDGSRLAAIGTSHGALIVMLAAERGTLFKAVVEGYGVMDIYGWWQFLKAKGYSTDDPLSRRVYGLGPQDKPEAFARRNVLSHVERLEAAVLVVQGGKDATVPPQQADRLVEALTRAGKHFETLRYPNEEHGFLIYPGDPASNRNREDAWRKIRSFLHRSL